MSLRQSLAVISRSRPQNRILSCTRIALNQTRNISVKSRLALPTKAHPQSFLQRRTYALSTEGDDISSKIDDITVHQYNSIADEYLETIADRLEELSEEFPQLDCELSQGVMTLAVPPNGTYVINKQPPNKQIWLSSPTSGPKRYDLIEGRWITLRDNTSLTDLIEEEIGQAVGAEIDLGTVN